MPIEIERKFLVTSDVWRDNHTPALYLQGYISVGPPASVRIRIADQVATLNIKQSTLDVARAEFEYEIPLVEAKSILDTLCTGNLIEKHRYMIDYEGFQWEVDEFLGENKGLVVAELELESEDQEFPHPPWLGDEVSHDKRYFNSYLFKHPYRSWTEK